MRKIYPFPDPPVSFWNGSKKREVPFTSVVATGADGVQVMHVNFVVFDGLQPDNANGTPDLLQMSLVNVDPTTGRTTPPQPLTFAAGYQSVLTMVDIEDGRPSPVAAELLAHPSAQRGVSQIKFSFNPNGYAGRFSLEDAHWRMRFAGDPGDVMRMTFVVDGVDTVAPWFHVPSSKHLVKFKPGGLETPFPGTPSESARPTRHAFKLPIYNYGTGPLVVDAVNEQRREPFSLKTSRMTIPPGSSTLAGQPASEASVTLDFAAGRYGRFEPVTFDLPANGAPGDPPGRLTVVANLSPEGLEIEVE